MARQQPTTVHDRRWAAEPELERGAVVDRYVIVSRVGAGGMGVVYAAWDPELDRKVALKLLRGAGPVAAAASSRLLREAQALARLAHPNVVAIHDVGTHAQQVWLAMEFVDGHTLRAWLEQRQPDWRATLELLVPIARGVAAAHAAGLCHRDLKPDNVMVGDDGRVRVMDFGLARSGESDAELDAREERPALPPSRVELTLTRDGALIGTPAYMAPEQLAGYEADARSDQFSLCVLMWEALYGERPFAGDTVEALETAMIECRPRPPTRAAKLPTWLRRALERGLDPDPDRRWPSIEALLDELGRGHARARRRGLGGATLALTAALAGTWGWQRAKYSRAVAACTDAGAELDALWDDAARSRVAEGLRRNGVGHAAQTSERVIALIDARAATWQELRSQVCVEALDGTRDGELLARSVACLDEQRITLAGLIEIMAELDEADAVVVSGLLPALAGLPELERCVDEASLRRRPARPDEPDAAARIDALSRELAGVEAELAAGRYAVGLPIAERLLVEAEALAYLPLETEVRLTVGDFARRAGRHTQAETALRRAFVDAGAIGDDGLAAVAATLLVHTVGVDAGRHREALVWADAAEMLLRRIDQLDQPRGADLLDARASIDARRGELEEARRGFERAREIWTATLGPDHVRVAEAVANLAMVHDELGDYEQALALTEESLRLRERALGSAHPHVAASRHNLALLRLHLGQTDEALAQAERALAIWRAATGPDSPDVARALNTMAVIHKARGDYPRARELYAEALALRERTLGPRHVEVANTLNNLAVIAKATGDYELARDNYERALSIWTEALGPDHPSVSAGLNNLAELHRNHGELERALELHERALALRERALGPDHPRVADSLDNLGLVRAAQGRLDEAKALHERGLEIRERVLGAEHETVAVSLNNLAEVELRAGDLDDAEAHFARALELMEASLGPDHLHLSYPLHGLGRVARARGAADAAIALLERGLALREAAGVGPGDRAELRAELARALDEAGDRDRARELGEEAAAELREAGRDDAASELEQRLR